jgi:hypothetical protein
MRKGSPFEDRWGLDDSHDARDAARPPRSTSGVGIVRPQRRTEFDDVPDTVAFGAADVVNATRSHPSVAAPATRPDAPPMSRSTLRPPPLAASAADEFDDVPPTMVEPTQFFADDAMALARFSAPPRPPRLPSLYSDTPPRPLRSRRSPPPTLHSRATTPLRVARPRRGALAFFLAAALFVSLVAAALVALR